MRDISRYYKILELEPGASPQEIKQAYKELAQVWHPDRFSYNPQLQKKSQERLKEINEAYKELRDFYRSSAQSPPAQVEQPQAPRPSPPTRSEPQQPTSNSDSNSQKTDTKDVQREKSEKLCLVLSLNLVTELLLAYPGISPVIQAASRLFFLLMSWLTDHEARDRSSFSKKELLVLLVWTPIMTITGLWVVWKVINCSPCYVSDFLRSTSTLSVYSIHSTFCYVSACITTSDVVFKTSRFFNFNGNLLVIFRSRFYGWGCYILIRSQIRNHRPTHYTSSTDELAARFEAITLQG